MLFSFTAELLVSYVKFTLLKCQKMLRRTQLSKLLIFLSDGDNNDQNVYSNLLLQKCCYDKIQELMQT